jgi:hypothetical protein
MGVSRNPRRFKGGNAPNAALFHISLQTNQAEKVRYQIIGHELCLLADRMIPFGQILL